MTSSLSIATPTDLLHAVPFLVGFHPAESVVLISLRSGEAAKIGLTVRLDYPDADADFSVIAERLVDHLIDDAAVGALVVVYRDDAIIGGGDDLFEALAAVIEDHGLDLHDALMVCSGQWWSLIDESAVPQPVPDFASSVVAAEHVLHGAALPWADEGALRATLVPTASERGDQIARACAARRDVVNREAILEGDSNRMRSVRRLHIRQGADAVDRVYAHWVARGSLDGVDVEDLALMMVGMHDVHVRDYAMGVHDDSHLDSALALWRTLLPLTPMGSVAPVATVLAAVAFECGDGALAQRAIDRAFDDRAGYPMASLLRQAMEAGWAPSAMTSMRKDLRAAVVATVRAA